MRTVTLYIYRFSDLSEEAQNRAVENNMRRRESIYPNTEEFREPLEAIQERYSFMALSDWQVDSCTYRYTLSEAARSDWTLREVQENLREDKEFLEEECPLTGWCTDSLLLVPLAEILDITDEEELNASARNTLTDIWDDYFSSWREVIAYFYSEKAAREELEASDDENFLYTGDFYA